MIGAFNTIKIGNDEIFRSNGFTLQREWIYAAEIVTCTGKFCADVVGWRYSNLSLEWDNLPQAQLEKILALSGTEVNMTFTNELNESVTEKVIPIVSTAQVTRLTDHNGDVAWQGVKLEVRFINAHN